MSRTAPLSSFVENLARLSHLGEAEQSALSNMPHRSRSFDRGGYILREGEPGEHFNILIEGFAYSSRTGARGGRAVLALHMESEPLDVAASSFGMAPCDVQAVGNASVALVARHDLLTLAEEYPQIGIALWRSAGRSASVLSEWLANVARRNARGRISHFFCEIAARQQAVWMGQEQGFVLPFTQEQIGDCTGLTAVHVNRVIQSLRKDRLIDSRAGLFHILDWEGLRVAGDFRPDYLRLA